MTIYTEDGKPLDAFAQTETHEGNPPAVETMTVEEMLRELVTGQREIIVFLDQVAKGMVEFQETAKSHPVLRMLFGSGNGG